MPLLRQHGAKRVVDIGCGVGAMVRTLLQQDFDAYGIDLCGLQKYWKQLDLPTERMFSVGSKELELPFQDNTIDFAFSFGVIEHVGTTEGHANRAQDYRAIRAQWAAEIFRTLRIGGCMLLAGPNRGFPVDTAHGPDSRASRIEKWLSAKVGATVHRTWGDNFLWSYGDLVDYLRGCDCSVTPISVAKYLHHSRVPKFARPFVKGYVDYLPKSLLGSGFNPWMAAVVVKLS